jgi:hypothetical protein
MDFFPFKPPAISAKRFNLLREISQGTEILSKVSAPLCLPMIKGEYLKTQVMENPLPIPIPSLPNCPRLLVT